MSATPESLPSASLKEHLIDCYFEWEQPWCQVVNEKLFRDSERYGGRYSSPCLVNSILAMGSRYSDRTDLRQSPANSNCAGQVFLARAEKMLNAELKNPTVTTVQALAILGILYVANFSLETFRLIEANFRGCRIRYGRLATPRNVGAASS